MNINDIYAFRDNEANSASDRMQAQLLILAISKEKQLISINKKPTWMMWLLMLGGAALLFVSFLGALM